MMEPAAILPFDLPKLYGRKEELRKLREAYENVDSTGEPLLALITGPPGVGKRTLVAKQFPVLLRGKFDRNSLHRREPYEVFVTAIGQLVEMFLSDEGDPHMLGKSHPQDKNTVKLLQDCTVSTLAERLRDDLRNHPWASDPILLELIPSLERIIPAEGIQKRSLPSHHSSSRHMSTTRLSENSSDHGNNGRSYQTTVSRFRLAFCGLLSRVSVVLGHPLVILMEDFHSADSDSLELIRLLMSINRKEKTKVLCIGTTPQMTLEDSHGEAQQKLYAMMPIADVLRELKEKRKLVNINLKLYPINMQQEILTDLLKPQQDVIELARLINEHTKGNIYHIHQLLRLLKDQNIIRQGEKSGSFIWDDEKIRLVNAMTITDLILETINQLSHPAREAIKCASFLGNDHVDDSALDLVLQTASLPSLKEAASRGLLVFSTKTGGYHFAHSWVRDAATSLVLPDEADQFCCNLGKRLWNSSSSLAFRKNVFLIASLVNKGISYMKESRERFKAAALNHDAARRAIELCSYYDASYFLSKGISFLGSNCWKNHYELAIALYSDACETDVAIGRYDDAVRNIEIVLRNARTNDEKLSAYKALIRSMSQQGNLEDAISVGISALRLIGIVLPKKATKFSIAAELLCLKLTLRGRSAESLIRLPSMEDPTKIKAMEILNLLVYVGYLARSPYAAIAGFRACRTSARYGNAENSPTAFAMYGTMLCGLGLSVTEGETFGSLALRMTSEEKYSQDIPMVNVFYGGFISHWTRPINEVSLDHLKYGFTAGMEKGQVDIAVNSKVSWVALSLSCGHQLLGLKREVKEVIGLCQVQRQFSSEMLSKILLQVILCLEGDAEDPSRLIGAAANFDDHLKQFQKTKNLTWKAALYYYSMMLAYLYRDHGHAADMAEGLGDLSKAPSAFFATPDIHFYEGLTWIACARTGLQRAKYRRKAKQRRNFLLKYSKGSERSYLTRFKLLDAEYQSLNASKGKKRRVARLYEEAIGVAKSQSYLSMEALSCELASEFHCRHGNMDLANMYKSKSIELYQEWGAIGKVRAMKESGKDLRTK